MNFDIKTEQLSDDAYVISLAGEVDLYTAPEFKQQLLEVIGQGGKEVDRRLLEHDLHRLDDPGCPRRRREAPPLERRAALARLQRPEHHEDLRDHRPRPRVHDLPVTRRGRGEDRGLEPASGLVRARFGFLIAFVALAATGCTVGTGGVAAKGDAAHGKQLFSATVRGVPHARRRRVEGHGRPEPRRRVRLRPRAGLQGGRRSARSSPTRSSSPATTARPARRCPGTSSRVRTSTTWPPTSPPWRASTRSPARRRPPRRPPRATSGGGGGNLLAAGKKAFKDSGCGACHTLAAAGSEREDRPRPRQAEGLRGGGATCRSTRSSASRS